ncbi:hypothetical protein T03_17599 [Trichinella britovi]|uniref:Uncharacterized protein n=1 Tax=Trichinella britovi TaxID=45882 RepID=A0A0V1DD00_TRIBR|nr:hypothetical protein T03_17599 [Trichinella britovi]
MSCKSYGVTAIDVHEVARLTIYACETIHICVAAHAIWCGSYVFGGSEWPSGPSRVDQMDDMQECDYICAPPLIATNKLTDHESDILQYCMIVRKVRYGKTT